MKLNFIVGKCYRTEGGHKVKCIDIGQGKKLAYVRFELEDGVMYATDLNGVYSAYEEQEFNIAGKWSETKDHKSLITAYETACNDIVKAFAEKQGIDFDYFVGSLENGWASFNETYQFQLSDIILDLKTEQPKGFILKWFNNLETYTHSVNYKSYIVANGKPLKTNTDIL